LPRQREFARGVKVAKYPSLQYKEGYNWVVIFIKTFASLLIASAGILVLVNSKGLALALQWLYIRNTSKIQESIRWDAFLFVNKPETWKTPFAWFLFRGGVIWFGIMLVITAYPIVFGPVYVGSAAQGLRGPSMYPDSASTQDTSYATTSAQEIRSLKDYDASLFTVCGHGTKEDFQPCAYGAILNDIMATGSIAMYAAQELIAIDTENANEMSDGDLKNEILSDLKLLNTSFDREAALQITADLSVFEDKRHLKDASIDAFVNGMLIKYGPCWGIPQGQCQE
jgi:hypothetical protein